MSEADYYFFLSYARGDRRVNPTIERFHHDLVNQVSLITGLTDRIGFLDTSDLEPGDVWPERMQEAISHCRVFVPVLSPRYFTRHYCGREWAAFAHRLAAAGQPPRLIQPVLLVSPADLNPMPRVVGELQNTHDGYPPPYGEHGLSFLSDLRGEHDNYIRFCKAFAARLKRVAEASHLEPSAVPALDTLDSVFHRPGTGLQDVALDAPSGRRLFVQFIYVAARRQEIEALGRPLVFHGDEGGYDWQPYMPDLDAEVNMLATELTGRLRFRYEDAPLDEHSIQRIQDAVQRNKIVVVVVDPWTARLEHYATWLKQLDTRKFLSCVIVIPWNPAETETAASRVTLERAVRSALYNTFQSPDEHTLAPWIDSEARFKSELAARLEAMQMRIIDRAQDVLKAETDAVFVKTMPFIVGTPPP